MTQPAKRASLGKSQPAKLSTEQVHEILREQILNHSIAPATRINITQLADELGTSATPIREALRLLQGDNLVVADSNKGYSTTNVFTPIEVRGLFEFRLLLEPWAARIAASNRLSNPAFALKTELEQLDLDRDSSLGTMIAHDQRFHLAILRATENSTVIQAYEQSHCHLHLFRAFRSDWDWRTSVDQHRSIANAIAVGDAEAAHRAMEAHLHSAYIGFSATRHSAESARFGTAPSEVSLIAGVSTRAAGSTRN